MSWNKLLFFSEVAIKTFLVQSLFPFRLPMPPCMFSTLYKNPDLYKQMYFTKHEVQCALYMYTRLNFLTHPGTLSIPDKPYVNINVIS